MDTAQVNIKNKMSHYYGALSVRERADKCID